MVDISNTKLGLLLLAAIVISLSSTFLLLGRFSGITGYATLNDSGTVNLNISDTLSINLLNAAIDFGNCQVNTTNGFSVVDSDQGAAVGDNSLCTGGAFPGFMTLENDGNVNANVTDNATGGGTFGLTFVAQNVI